MQNTYHRHDISDETWELLENHLPGRKGTWGGNARDNRKFINAVFLDSADRRTVARSPARLRRLEEYP